MAAAEWIINCIQQKLKKQQRFTWLLSGGNTPKQLYSLLATEKFNSRIDWSKLHIFFGDERVVPFEDERNNGRMSAETLLNHVNIPAGQVHFITTDKDPAMAASEYENLLHHYFEEAGKGFDLALLGMGDDGHTLSLFPGSPLIHENDHWVRALYLPAQQMYRITLMPAIVNVSASIAFLVTGSSKAAVLKKVLQGVYQPEQYPSQLIQPANNELNWFVDKEAAALL